MPFSFWNHNFSTLNHNFFKRLFALNHLIWLLICLIVPTCFANAHPAQTNQSVQNDYKAPTIIIPFAAHKPTIDGIIHEEEWQSAVSLNALQTTAKAVSARQTRFWLMWDADNLYVAMRSPLRPGERLIQALRERDHDVNAVFDDSYEIWLDLATHSADGQPVFFQYLSNFAGARWDVMQEPAVGNSRLSWTAGWKPQNHMTPDGKFWEMEMAIPRRSLYKETPFQEGFSFTGLLARNFKRPWDQVTLAGSGSFSVRETYARYVLSQSAPAIHLLSVGDPMSRTFGLALAAYGQIAQTLQWRFDSDNNVHERGTLSVQPGKLTELPPNLALEREGKGAFRIQVLASDGKTVYLDWSALRNWGGLEALTQPLHDTGNHVDLTITLNPVQDYLRVTGDFIDYDARNAITHCQVIARDNRQHTIAQKEVRLDTLAYARDILTLPHLTPGMYSAELIAYDKNDHALLTRKTEFVKKDPAQAFPWWHTKLGNAEKVLAPWTPVTYTQGRFSVWNRTMTVGDTGLPTEISAHNHNLLAQPMTLIAQMADGTVQQAHGANLRTISQTSYRTVIEVRSQLGKIAVRSLVTVEYDGMMKVEMDLTPEQATSIRSLKLAVPLRAEVASYHANAVPYFEHINMGEQFAPEMDYFSEEWRTRVSRGLSYGRTLADYMVYHVGQWAKDCGIDGFYLDNIFPIADDNLEAGRGYRLPDGRIQPAYQMFDTRRYLLRLRAALAEQGKHDKFVLHITNHMIAPWIGAADIALDGEHHVIYPEMNKDFMDFWSLERLRVDDPATWGVAVNFLQEYQGAWEPQKLKKAMRAYTGMQLLDDVLASANANGLNPEVWQGRERFGMTAPSIRFMGYWEQASGLISETKQVYVSGWLAPTTPVRAGKMLLAIVNTGAKTTASVRIDAMRLKLPNAGHWRVFDAETQEPLAISATGELKLPLERHDYRQVIIETFQASR